LCRLPGEALEKRCGDFSVSDLVADTAVLSQFAHLNYGVTFSPICSVKLVLDIWSHNFDLHLPE